MVDVFLTFDTELSPGLHGIQKVSAEDNYRRMILGQCARGSFGLPFILETLDEFDLRGVFFIESLCAAIVGEEMLGRIIDPVRKCGHDAELHVHTEWLRFEFTPWRSHEDFWNIHQFDVDRQQEILERAAGYFTTCGGGDPVAYRAGSFGANTETLTALGRAGLRFDSSYNLGYMGTSCRMANLGTLAHARRIGDVWEVPVSVFADRPGHLRHTQLGASSFRELRASLEFAARTGLSTAVVVGHSFEFMNTRRTAPLPLVIRRFRRLCRFLADNRDSFRVIGFDEADPSGWRTAPDVFHQSSLPATVLRLAEQASLRLAR